MKPAADQKSRQEEETLSSAPRISQHPPSPRGENPVVFACLGRVKLRPPIPQTPPPALSTPPLPWLLPLSKEPPSPSTRVKCPELGEDAGRGRTGLEEGGGTAERLQREEGSGGAVGHVSRLKERRQSGRRKRRKRRSSAADGKLSRLEVDDHGCPLTAPGWRSTSCRVRSSPASAQEQLLDASFDVSNFLSDSSDVGVGVVGVVGGAVVVVVVVGAVVGVVGVVVVLLLTGCRSILWPLGSVLAPRCQVCDLLSQVVPAGPGCAPGAGAPEAGSSGLSGHRVDPGRWS